MKHSMLMLDTAFYAIPTSRNKNSGSALGAVPAREGVASARMHVGAQASSRPGGCLSGHSAADADAKTYIRGLALTLS